MCPSYFTIPDFITAIEFGKEYSHKSYRWKNFLHSPVTSFLTGSDVHLCLFQNTFNLCSSQDGKRYTQQNVCFI